MDFLRPNVLWALWVLPLLFALSWYAHVRVRDAAHRFVGQVMTARLLPILSTQRTVVRTLLLCCGVGLVVTALAGPYWDTRDEEVTARGIDVCVALDVSKSMLTENETVRPLDRAKAVIERLVDTIRGDRVGLVVFAGTANVSCVMTQDQSFFRKTLRASSPADAGRGGTHIGDALVEALRMLDPGWARVHSRVLQAIFDPNFVEGNRPRLEELLGTKDLDTGLAELVDPRWNAEHEDAMQELFGRDWRLAGAGEEDPPWFASLDPDDPAAEIAKGGRVILLFTDGYDQSSAPQLAARIAGKRDVRLVTIGIGDPASPEGRPLILDGRPQRTQQGEPILIHLDQELLRRLATLGRGMYVPPGELLNLPELYRTYIDPLDKKASRSAVVPYPNDRFQWFLIPGILLLLAHACMPPYRVLRADARTARDAARAASLAFLLALPTFLTGCADGELSQRREEALAALEKGSYEQAEEVLTSLQEENPEDARVAFNRGLALQELGRFDDARREYQKALTGNRVLRARVLHHLGTLAVDRLRKVPEAPEGDPGQDAFDAFAQLDEAGRSQVSTDADEALAHFAQAAKLDPEYADPRENRDRLGTWYALLRDTWSRLDREKRIEELRAKPGPEFAAALETWQREIGARLGTDPPIDLALEQKALVQEIATLVTKIETPPEGDAAQTVPALDDAQRSALAEAAHALEGPMTSAEEALERIDLPRAAEQIDTAVHDILALWSRWADPKAVLERLRDDQKNVQLHARSLIDAPEGESAPTPEEEIQRRLFLGQVAFDVQAEERGLAERLEPWAERVRSKPLADGNADVGAHNAWGVEHATGALAEVVATLDAELYDRASLERQLEEVSMTFAEMVEAITWPESTPAQLAEAAAEQATTAAREARHEQRALGRRDLGRAARRLPFLKSALQKALQPNEEAGEAGDAQRDVLARLVQVLDALRDEFEAIDGLLASDPGTVEPPAAPPHEAAATRLEGAANVLWSLWSQFTTFDDLLARGTTRARESVTEGDALRARVNEATTLEPSPLESADLERVQRHVTFLIERLEERVPAEIEKLRAPAQRPPSENPDDPAPPAEDENAPVLAVLEKAKEALAGAADQSHRAEDHIRAQRLDSAREGQAEARDVLERLKKDLEEARRPLVDRLQDLLTAVRESTRGLDDLPDPAKEKEAFESRWQALEEGAASWTAKASKLDEAVKRFVAEMAAQAGSDPNAGQAPDRATVEQALTAQMQAIRAALDGVRAPLEARDEATTRKALAQVHSSVRGPWSGLSELERMLREALAEEEQWIADTRAFEPLGDDAPIARWNDAKRWQVSTRDLVDPMLQRAQMEHAAMQQQKQQAAAQGPPPGGADAESQSIPEKAIDKLPQVRDAMHAAIEHLEAKAFAEARERQEEARRLIEEILERPPQDENQDQQQQQPQDQDQEQDDSQQPKPEPRKLSPEEVQRLLRAAQERQPKPEKERMAKRVPVEEDH